MSNTTVEYLIQLRDKFSSPIDKATKKTERLNKAVGGVQKSFTTLAGAMGVGIGVAGLVQFQRAIVDSLVNYEYFSASLRTLMLGDAQAAKALENQLVQTAKTTPFSLVEVQDATKQLLAYGFSAGSVVKNIRMLGDVASALKIPFADIAYLYGTLKTQGRAYTRDIQQFQTRGIPVAKQLAKQLGVTEDKITELVSTGKIGFHEVEKAFQSMTAEGGMFFNMMTEQSKTTGGQISALGDSFEQLKVNIGKSQTGIIAGTVSFANRLVEYIGNSFKSSNAMFENFAKYGAQQFKWYESFFTTRTFMFATGFQKAINKMFVENPAETVAQSAEQLNKLNEILAKNREALRKGEIDQTEFFRKRATILGAFEAVKGQMSLLTKPTTGTQAAAQGMGEGAAATKEKGGTGLNILESRGVQNFNISIDKLVEMIKVETTQLKEGAGQIKEIVAQSLIEAVNDFQLMATK